MKSYRPKEFQDAVEIDRIIRNGVRGTTQKLYIHISLMPLEKIDFSIAEDHGQMCLPDCGCAEPLSDIWEQ